MDTSNPHPAFVAGEFIEYLGVSAGTLKGLPVGILTFRPHATYSERNNLMILRPQLERLRDDITFLLQRSPTLQNGPSPEVSLGELEASRDRLG